MAGEYLTGRVVHIDQPLSNMAINYRPAGFIGDQVFPVVSVQKQTDLFVIYEQADLYRAPDTKRSRGDEAKKISYRTSSDKYYADNYALATDVTLEDRINADPAFVSKLEAGRVMRVQDGLALDMDLRVSSLAFNSANAGSSAVVASGWTDHSNSNPLENIWTAMDNVQGASGYKPNSVLFGNDAWRHFRRNDRVADRAQNPPGNKGGPNVPAGGLLPSISQIKDMLEVERLVIGTAYHNTTEEGLAQALTPIWTDHVLVYYAPLNPSMEAPSFGYSFRWAAPGLPNMQVERHPFDTRKKIDTLEIGYYQDEKVTGAPLGFLLTNVNSDQ